MRDYRIYILNAHGRIVRAIELICADDAEAMDKAALRSGGAPVEVWQRARMVGHVAATAAT